MEMRLFKQASKPCRSLAKQLPALVGALASYTFQLLRSAHLTSFLSGRALPFDPGRIEMSEHLLPIELEFQKSPFFFIYFLFYF